MGSNQCHVALIIKQLALRLTPWLVCKLSSADRVADSDDSGLDDVLCASKYESASGFDHDLMLDTWIALSRHFAVFRDFDES